MSREYLDSICHAVELTLLELEALNCKIVGRLLSDKDAAEPYHTAMEHFLQLRSSLRQIRQEASKQPLPDPPEA